MGGSSVDWIHSYCFGGAIYYVTNKPRLVAGWALVLFAGYSIIVNWSLEADSIILESSLMGILITVVLHLLCKVHRVTILRRGVTEPLDEEEIKHVSAILSSHLSHMEGTADE